MSKDKLLKRKKELQEIYEKTMGNLQAVSGALQDVEYWLKDLEEESKQQSEQAQ